MYHQPEEKAEKQEGGGGGAKNRIFKVMLIHRSARRECELLEGPGGMFPPKILKSRVSKMLFSASSTGYFVKNKSDASIKSHLFHDQFSDSRF